VAREVKSGQEEEEEDDFWATDKGVCGLGPGKRNSGRWPGLGRGTTHWVMTPDKEHWGRGGGGWGGGALVLGLGLWRGDGGSCRSIVARERW
jgi:hypothetical protein